MQTVDETNKIEGKRVFSLVICQLSRLFLRHLWNADVAGIHPNTITYSHQLP